MYTKECTFIANPHYYDYIKEMVLKDGKIEMVYGECQSVRFDAIGKYEFKFINEESGILIIKNLKEKDSDIEIYDNFNISFKKEKGCFILKKEIMWNVDDLDTPYLIAYERFLFEKDPFNLDDESIFFKSWNESTKRELVKNNISVNEIN